MFCLLLLIPTVYMHSAAQVSQMIIVFPEERQKNKKTLHIQIFSEQKQVSNIPAFKKYYQINYHWEGWRNMGRSAWVLMPRRWSVQCFLCFPSWNQGICTHSRKGLIELTRLKKLSHRTNTMNTCGRKKTQKNLQTHLTHQLMSRFPTWTEKCMILWMAHELGPML